MSIPIENNRNIPRLPPRRLPNLRRNIPIAHIFNNEVSSELEEIIIDLNNQRERNEGEEN